MRGERERKEREIERKTSHRQCSMSECWGLNTNDNNNNNTFTYLPKHQVVSVDNNTTTSMNGRAGTVCLPGGKGKVCTVTSFQLRGPLFALR